MQYNDAIINMPQYPFARLAATRKKLVDAGIKVFDFSKGDPIEPTPSFIKEALVKSIPEVSQYPAVKGLPELRTTISTYLSNRFKVNCNPETEIISCNGTKEALFNLTALVFGKNSPKNTIIGSAPGFMVIERSAITRGAEFYAASLNNSNKYLLELGELPKSVLEKTALALINYPNNPTGARCDLDYFKRQVEVAHRYGFLLCSDECYVELYLNSEPAPSILEVTREGVIALQSCSKRSGMTGYRSGFIAGDATVLKHYLSFRDAIGTESPAFIQHAAIAAWKDAKHVEERRKVFATKREILTNFFKSRDLKYLDSPATFYLWLKAPTGVTGTAYANKLLEKGILVTPGEFFGGDSSEYVRVALVPTVEQCVEAVRLWHDL